VKITEETTIGELMTILKESQTHLSENLDDPIVQFDLYSDGGFEITEGYYGASATCNSTIKINNEFTGLDVSNIIMNRLNEGKE